MSPTRRKLLLMAGAALSSLSLLAQPATNGVYPKSPVALFRELLAMSPEERKAALATRPPAIQQRILEKLGEYQILPEELRDVRLQETELRWYLRPLMDLPRTNRAARLALIPENVRKLVEDRLLMWDILPPPLQDEWKNDDLVANYFAQIQAGSSATAAESVEPITPQRSMALMKGLGRWTQMSEEQRQAALAGFNRFFELTPEEKQESLNTVSDADRQQMEQTLASYGKLTPEQRKKCIDSFEKFATMSVAERDQFLKNAEQWSRMSPEERQKWRDLVNVAPITPPGASPPRPGAPSSSYQPPGLSIAAD